MHALTRAQARAATGGSRRQAPEICGARGRGAWVGRGLSRGARAENPGRAGGPRRGALGRRRRGIGVRGGPGKGFTLF
eukprot:497207-Prymnesium_polylepis.1